VKIAYGNDNDTQSAQQTQALLQAFPNLKAIISPTSVGVVAAARVLSQAGKCSIALTGLGTPNTMRAYVKSGCVKKFALWNEQDFGYLAAYTAHNVVVGKLTGKAGQSFKAGRLGSRTVKAGGLVILSKPLVFTRQNIDKFRF
jgi:rhamnose transport system substrate-binding protein